MWTCGVVILIISLSSGRLPGQTEESADRDSAALVQGALPHPPVVRAREVARARAHGERAAAGRARAACRAAQAAGGAAGARPHRLVSHFIIYV